MRKMFVFIELCCIFTPQNKMYDKYQYKLLGLFICIFTFALPKNTA
jgi:hypothetical protein